jgi:hypothetical protein
MEDNGNTYGILIRMSEESRPLRMPGREWIILKWILESNDWGFIYLTCLAQDMDQQRDPVNTETNLRAPEIVERFFSN